MKPLIVLLATFAVSLVILFFISGHWDWAYAGRIGMATMLFFTGVAHFTYTKGMELMIPPQIPFKNQLVYATGIIEIVSAIGLLSAERYEATGVLLIAFFILVLPANISAAMRRVDYQKGTYEGDGINYLWFRVPLQLFFIGWVWLCTYVG